MAQGKKLSKTRKAPQSGRKAKAAKPKAKKKTGQKKAVRRRKPKADVAGHVLGLMEPLGGSRMPGSLGLDRKGYTATGTTSSVLPTFVGRVYSSQGLVCVEHEKALTAVSPKGEGVLVCVGDTVTTFAESYAQVIFSTGGQVDMNQNTVLMVVGSREVKDITSRSAIENVMIQLNEIWTKITKQQEPVPWGTGSTVGIKG